MMSALDIHSLGMSLLLAHGVQFSMSAFSPLLKVKRTLHQHRANGRG
jgi:hypothetical protein